MSAASKPKQGWLARQREARRGGWRVGVQRDLDGSRMLLAARRAARPSFGRDFIVCAAAYMAALVLLGGCVYFRESWLSAALMWLSLPIGLAAVFKTGTLFRPEDTGWVMKGLYGPEDPVSGALAVAVEGVEPTSVGMMDWRYVPDERVPALEAAYEQTRAECEGEAAEAAEAKRARTVREEEEFIQSLARQEEAR